MYHLPSLYMEGYYNKYLNSDFLCEYLENLKLIKSNHNRVADITTEIQITTSQSDIFPWQHKQVSNREVFTYFVDMWRFHMTLSEIWEYILTGNYCEISWIT